MAKNTELNDSFEFPGIPISPGIAIGPVFCFKQIDLEATQKFKFPVENMSLEMNRFKAAIQKSRDQLNLLQKNVETTGKKEVAQIFEAQSFLLQDDFFLEKIKSTILEHENNAEYVLAHEIEALNRTFVSMKNEILKTKSLDIQDVYYRLLRNLLEIDHVRLSSIRQIKEPIILVAEKLLPSDLTLLDKEKLLGIVMEEGSSVSHVAIISKSLGIPSLTQVLGIGSMARSNSLMIVDAFEGKAILHPSKEQLAVYKQKQEKSVHPSLPQPKRQKCQTQDGIRIKLEANVGSLQDVKEGFQNGAEGIGLLRSELFYMSQSKVPSLQEEYDFYKKVLKMSKGRPVTIRLLDVGADKSPATLNIPNEESPQLGTKGIRYLLNNTDLFLKHLRSILRAGQISTIKILLPFVSLPLEVDQVHKILNSLCEEEGLDRGNFKLGMMIEIPSVLFSLSSFIEKIDFFSIGTNDLVQYLFAASRENGKLEEYRKASLPILLGIIEHIISLSAKNDKEVTVCGELASNPILASLLVGAGVKCLSVQPNAIPLIRNEIIGKSLEELKSLSKEFIHTHHPQEILNALQAGRNKNG